MNGGLELVEIAQRTGIADAAVRAVLVDELEHGRVARDEQGRYRLNAAAFDACVLQALRAIDHTDNDGHRPKGGTTMSETTALAPVDDRRARLRELEQVIETGWDAVVAVGLALREIRDERLYLELDEGLTFETYCKSRWTLARRTAYQQIDAADVHDAVCANGAHAIPITSERVGRELAPLLRSGGPAKVIEAWSKVSDRYRDQRPPTAREVHRVLVEEGYRPRVGRASAGKTNRSVLLGQVGDKLAKSMTRLRYFVDRELGVEPLSSTARERAARYATECRALARVFDALSEAAPVDDARAALDQAVKTAIR